jgi:predicted RNA-binding protein with PIN domain
MTLLIDGHNLLGTGLVPGVQLGDADDEWLLVQRLRSFAATRRQAMTVVFDSGLGPAPQWQLSGGGVTVRFASPGVEADALIVHLLRASGQPGQVTVVTNDQGLAGQVRAAGGQVRSANQFAAQLAPPKPRTPSLAEPVLNPRDPGFADIYQGFVAVEKDQVRFGAEIDLDATVWIERLYGDDLAEAARAARWLGRFGRVTGLDPLLDALSHRAGQVRAAALLALADLGQRSAVPAIAAHLAGDPSSMVREAAAQALGRLGGAPAENALQAALADPKAKVRKSAAASLAQVQARR